MQIPQKKYSVALLSSIFFCGLLIATTTSFADTAPNVEQRSLVEEIQKSLKALDYDPGFIDGLWGNKTQNALKLYLIDYSINADSKPSKEVLASLQGSMENPKPTRKSSAENLMNKFYYGDGLNQIVHDMVDAGGFRSAIKAISMNYYVEGKTDDALKASRAFLDMDSLYNTLETKLIDKMYEKLNRAGVTENMDRDEYFNKKLKLYLEPKIEKEINDFMTKFEKDDKFKEKWANKSPIKLKKKYGKEYPEYFDELDGIEL
jgi:hypothetical protein